MIRIACAACALVAASGCFQTSLGKPCGPSGDCPVGLTCNAQQVCALPSPADAGDLPDARMLPIDALPIDAPSGPPADARACFGAGILVVCFDTLPTVNLELPSPAHPSNLDTNNPGNCTQIITQMGGPELCLIAAPRITVMGPMAATGSRPLVLLGLDRVDVNAVLDVSSRAIPRRVGAGANPLCGTAGRGGNDTGGAGGGAGGSFGTFGGRGGEGDINDNGIPVNGGVGGIAAPPQPLLTVVRGGCPGGFGGNNSGGSTTGGANGDGGGAVYLIAGTTIVIDSSGDVFASGSGGTGDSEQDGGGGGGSGGAIVLDAPSIIANGRLVANGGAGGGGGSPVGGGGRGDDGTTDAWNVRASGGRRHPMSTTGEGAEGTAIGVINNIDGQQGDGGGGGGGGGLGMILHYGSLQTTEGTPRISPAPISRQRFSSSFAP